MESGQGWRVKAAAFAAIFRDPDPADVEWLAATATHGDADHAQWELRYAKRLSDSLPRSLTFRRSHRVVVAKEIAGRSARSECRAGKVGAAERQFSRAAERPPR